MDTRFDEKVALVTGAAGSIGRAIALAFAQAGATVVVVDIDSNGAEALARTPDEIAGPALFLCSPLASYINGATPARRRRLAGPVGGD